MFRLIQEFFIPARITNEEERSNIRLIINIISVTLLISILGILALGIPLHSNRIILAMVLIALANTSGLIAIRLDQMQFARVITPLAGWVAITGLIATGPTGVHDVVGFALAVIIIIATITLGKTGTIIFSLLAIGSYVGIALLEINGVIVNLASSTTVYDDVVVSLLVGLAMMGVMNGLVGRLNESLAKASEAARTQAEINKELRELQTTLEERIQKRTAELNESNQRNESRARQFEAVAQVARSISSIQDFDLLLTQITNLISREFGFYHLGIFLLDSRKEYAVLSASNSEGGQRMLERGHRLRVGETGIVGSTTKTGKARISLDTGADAVYFNNPDLPETHSEIALPLIIGEEIIGALDVQSKDPNAFHEDDINVLGTLADQVSIAIQNARQFDATRKALAESETLSRQFVQTGWQGFTKRQNLLGVRHTGAKATLIYGKNKKSKGEESASLSRDQARPRARGASLSLPVKLRGEIIGTVDVRSPANRQFDQDELDIVTAIIERAAIAMENSRLLEDAQRRATMERTIGEISTNIGAFTDAEAILRATVHEIGQKIGGARVVFELGPQDKAEKRSKSK